jgi:hypothetical protein
VQRRNAVLVLFTGIPGARISYVQFCGMNSAQFSVRIRRAGTHDNIFGAVISLLMQMKFVGINPPWSPAQSRAARQMEVVALAQPTDSARFFAAEAMTLKTTATKATAIGRSILARLLMAW